jgi:hypothetical protein
MAHERTTMIMDFVNWKFDPIEGMCFKDSAAFTIYLMDRFFDEGAAFKGVVAEIGVWKGRYLASIYQGAAKARRRCTDSISSSGPPSPRMSSPISTWLSANTPA